MKMKMWSQDFNKWIRDVELLRDGETESKVKVRIIRLPDKSPALFIKRPVDKGWTCVTLQDVQTKFEHLTTH